MSLSVQTLRLLRTMVADQTVRVGDEGAQARLAMYLTALRELDEELAGPR